MLTDWSKCSKEVLVWLGFGAKRYQEKLSWFRLEKQRLWRDLVTAFNYLMEPDSAQNCTMKGQETIVTDVKGKFLRDIRKKTLYNGCGYPQQNRLPREAVETVRGDIQISAFHRPEQSDLTSNLYMHRAGGTSRGSLHLKFFSYFCMYTQNLHHSGNLNFPGVQITVK